MHTSRLVALAGLFVIPWSGCDCSDPLATLAPIIEIGDAFDPTFSVCNEDFVRDCNYDFGEVPAGQGRIFSFVIKNPSPVNLQLYSFEFEAGSDPGFTIEGEAPTVIESNIGATGKVVTVKFVPTVFSTVQGRLLIDSNAENLEADEKVVINLTATGIDLGQPDIVVTPPTCDFGDVGVGATGFCDLSIENAGQRELQILDAGFTAGTPTPQVFGAQTPLIIPTLIAAGTAISVRMYARPNSAAALSGALYLGSNDPDEAVVEVPLLVQGAQSPTAVAEVRSINGAPNNSATPAVEPLDNVVLTGVNSSAARAGGTITGYLWELIERPIESSVVLSSTNAVETGFRFNSASGNVSGIDVAGTFVVRLTVTDDLGAVSTNDARVTLNAIPTGGLNVQMTWDSPEHDVDMHMTRNGGNACSNNDCYYLNCDGAAGLNWGGGNRNANLDIDDVDGFGPENISVQSPGDASYEIGAHMYRFDSGPPTNVTVRIFIGGALAGEYFGTLSNDDDFWRVARVQWNGGSPTIIPLGTVSSNWSCGGAI